MIQLYLGDCLKIMNKIQDQSIDMILCDLPYGITACKWDSVIPLDELWEQYSRIIKKDGCIALFGTMPFLACLIYSNILKFKHEWIWEKEQGVGFQLAKKRPMQNHEHVAIFSYGKLKYLPIMQESKLLKIKRKRGSNRGSDSSPLKYSDERTSIYDKRYPKSIIKFNRERGLHPTQKPVMLLEYLIRTYTNENETILDNCMGSGSTGVACINTNRNFIGIEKDEKYFEIAKNRIENTNSTKKVNI